MPSLGVGVFVLFQLEGPLRQLLLKLFRQVLHATETHAE